MLTSPKYTCTKRQHEATTQVHERFIDRHRLVLLHYLDGLAPASAKELDALSFVENVLTEWHKLFDSLALVAPTLKERTFWSALYQLEDLVELPGSHTDPHERIMMENLVDVREMLRHRQPLPEYRFMATRPDGS